MAGWGMAVAYLEGLLAFFGAVITLIGAFAAMDKALQGRIRELIQWYLNIPNIEGKVEANGSKLDELHDDHMTTMGGQVAVAENLQDLIDVVYDQHDVGGERPQLKLDQMRERAYERGADFPGDFYSGDD